MARRVVEKDPCKCSEHECKQMLMSNDALRYSMRKLLNNNKGLRTYVAELETRLSRYENIGNMGGGESGDNLPAQDVATALGREKTDLVGEENPVGEVGDSGPALVDGDSLAEAEDTDEGVPPDTD